MATLRTNATGTTTMGTPTTSAAAPSAAVPACGAFSAADEAFLGITASLFAPSFLVGAGVLLASYDDEHEPPVGTLSTVGRRTSTTAPAPTSASA